MTAITTRATKGTPLTNDEVDANFANLNTDKMAKASNLADLADVSTSRTNIGVYSKSEVDETFLRKAGEDGVAVVNGAMGLGTSSPADLLHVAKSGGSGNGGRVRIQNSGVRQWSIGTKDASFTLYDETAAAERASMDTSGNLSLTAGNLKLASGKGIAFSANSNASGMTSAVLDDYEVGTWTPTFSYESGGTPPTAASVYNFTYTKIGRLVHITGYVFFSSVGNGITLQVSGLPFAGNASFNMAPVWTGSGSVAYTCFMLGGTTQLIFGVAPGSSRGSSNNNLPAELCVQMVYTTS